jgi:hypothetical protein
MCCPSNKLEILILINRFRIERYKKMSNKNLPDKQQKFEGMLTLALIEDNDNTRDQCPADEQIAAYFDGLLSADEEQKLLCQLPLCPDSYQQWLNLSETLDFTHQDVSQKVANKVPQVEKIDWLQAITDWFSVPKMAFGGVLSGLFAVLLILNLQSDPFSELTTERQLSQSFDDFQSLHLASVDVSVFISQVRTKSAFNLITFPEKEAYSAGFKSGLMRILRDEMPSDKTQKLLSSLPDKIDNCISKQSKEKVFCESQTKLNYQLGVWSAIIVHACQDQDKLTEKFIRHQEETLKQFVKQFKNYQKSDNSNGSMAKRVIDLQPFFTKINNDRNEECSKITELVQFGIRR